MHCSRVGSCLLLHILTILAIGHVTKKVVTLSAIISRGVRGPSVILEEERYHYFPSWSYCVGDVNHEVLTLPPLHLRHPRLLTNIFTGGWDLHEVQSVSWETLAPRNPFLFQRLSESNQWALTFSSEEPAITPTIALIWMDGNGVRSAEKKLIFQAEWLSVPGLGRV